MPQIRAYGCIAERLGHSFSKEIHRAIGDYSYELQELAPENVGAFLTRREFIGINVTIPYKETVIPYLDEIEDSARAIGAVNTIVNRDGKLYGYNTDVCGMTALIRRQGISLRDKKVLILGTGGTSKTAREVARRLGAREILPVSRSGKDGAITYGEAVAHHADAGIILNTTPVGMFPNPDAKPLDLAPFARLEGLIDCVYNPLRTDLVREAIARGVPASGGLYMLVAQAVRAAELFFDATYPAEKTDEVYRAVLSEKENIVLIGMPASGKSTVGKLLAERLGFDFVDTDEEIVRTSGRSIPELFTSRGEAGFRDLEAAAIRDAGMKNHTVVATGGGAILRKENIEALRRNGRLFFLDRPLECLIPTADRPTASNAEMIAARYRERYPIYSSVADAVIRTGKDGTPEDAVGQILEQRERLIL